MEQLFELICFEFRDFGANT